MNAISRKLAVIELLSAARPKRGDRIMAGQNHNSRGRFIGANRMYQFCKALFAILIIGHLNIGATQEKPDSGKTKDTIAQIIEEGMNHSQAMTNLSYLCNAIGPR